MFLILSYPTHFCVQSPGDIIFGSSDEVLGTVESGVDFEKRILEIYQKCRTPEEIEQEFNLLQKELEAKINQSMQKARDTLFENFDADVHERLKLSVTEYLDRYTRYFWALTVFELGYRADFDDLSHSFNLLDEVASCPLGKYSLIKKGTDETNGILYRMSHPLGQYVLDQALHKPVSYGKVTFNISRHTSYRISQVEQLKGQSGYLTLYKYVISSFDQEEFLLFAGCLQDGSLINAEQCKNCLNAEVLPIPSIMYHQLLEIY